MARGAFRNQSDVGVSDFNNDIVLLGAEVFLSELNSSDGSIQGWRSMGCADAATITRDETKVEVTKKCQGIGSILEFITQVKTTLKLSIQNAGTFQNIAEFLAGTASSYTNPAVAGVTDVVQIHASGLSGGDGLVKGQTVLLVNSSGKRIYDIDKTKLTVKQSADEMTWGSAMSQSTDYSVNEAEGSIHLLTTSAFTNGDALRITLTADGGATTPIYQTDAGSVGKRYVGIRLLVSNGVQNEAKAEVLVYACFLGSDGDLALSGTDIAKLGFTGTCAESTYYGTAIHVNDVPTV